MSTSFVEEPCLKKNKVKSNWGTHMTLTAGFHVHTYMNRNLNTRKCALIEICLTLWLLPCIILELWLLWTVPSRFLGPDYDPLPAVSGDYCGICFIDYQSIAVYQANILLLVLPLTSRDYKMIFNRLQMFKCAGIVRLIFFPAAKLTR